MYIILEYYILENFIINFLILYINKIINQNKGKLKTILFASILASIYSLVFFYPSLLFLTKPFTKIIISMIIVKVAYNSKNIKLFLNEILGFYLVSFIFAGVTIGLSYAAINPFDLLKSGNLDNGKFNVKFLVYGITIAIFISYKLFNYHNKKILKKDYVTELKISLNNKTVSINALIDTGNTLIEPFSKKPVAIIEYESLKELLPNEMLDLIISHENKEYLKVEKILRGLNDKLKIKFIPFQSIGNNSGMLIGFQPDHITIKINNKELLRKDFIIGIYKGKLNVEGEYTGLLHYELINGGYENDNY